MWVETRASSRMSNLYPSTGDMPTIQPQPSQPVAWAEPVVPQPAAIAPQAHQPVVATGVVVMPSAVAQAQPVMPMGIPQAQPQAQPAVPMGIPQVQPVVPTAVPQAQNVAVATPIGGAGGANVLVHLSGMPLVPRTSRETASPYRQYELTISVGAVEHTLSARYSKLEQTLTPFATSDITWPRDLFSWFSDYVTNEVNVRARGEGIRHFLHALLNQADEGVTVGDRKLHAAMQIEERTPIQNALMHVAAQRKRLADEARAAEAARLAAIAKQQLDDAHFAQTFNSSLANLAPGALSTITYPREQDFELRNKFWGWGDATIKGPGGHGWFRMVRTNPSIFGEVFKNAHFASRQQPPHAAPPRPVTSRGAPPHPSDVCACGSVGQQLRQWRASRCSCCRRISAG